MKVTWGVFATFRNWCSVLFGISVREFPESVLASYRNPHFMSSHVENYTEGAFPAHDIITLMVGVGGRFLNSFREEGSGFEIRRLPLYSEVG